MRYRTKTIEKTDGIRRLEGGEHPCTLFTIRAVPMRSEDPEENLKLTDTVPREGITIVTDDPELAGQFKPGKAFGLRSDE